MTATAAAFYNLYKTLPRHVKDEVKNLLDQEATEAQWTKSGWDEAEEFFKSIRKGLPVDYHFDREEANER